MTVHRLSCAKCSCSDYFSRMLVTLTYLRPGIHTFVFYTMLARPWKFYHKAFSSQRTRLITKFNIFHNRKLITPPQTQLKAFIFYFLFIFCQCIHYGLEDRNDGWTLYFWESSTFLLLTGDLVVFTGFVCIYMWSVWWLK